MRPQDLVLSAAILVLFSLSLASAMYEHQIGENDWNKLNIGQIQQLYITSDRVYF